jgi:hypothetical protein
MDSPIYTSGKSSRNYRNSSKYRIWQDFWDHLIPVLSDHMRHCASFARCDGYQPLDWCQILSFPLKLIGDAIEMGEHVSALWGEFRALFVECAHDVKNSKRDDRFSSWHKFQNPTRWPFVILPNTWETRETRRNIQRSGESRYYLVQSRADHRAIDAVQFKLQPQAGFLDFGSMSPFSIPLIRWHVQLFDTFSVFHFFCVRLCQREFDPALARKDMKFELRSASCHQFIKVIWGKSREWGEISVIRSRFSRRSIPLTTGARTARLQKDKLGLTDEVIDTEWNSLNNLGKIQI